MTDEQMADLADAATNSAIARTWIKSITFDEWRAAHV